MKKTIVTFCAGLAGAFPGAASSLAAVSTLPPLQFSAAVLGGGFDITTTDGAPLSRSAGGNTLIATTVASIPQVTAYVDGPNFLEAQASIVYSFEIIGSGTTVNVGIASNGGVSQSAGAGNGSVQLLLDGYQIAFANIDTSQNQYIGAGPPCVSVGSFSAGPCSRTYSLDGTSPGSTFNLTVDTVHTISMSAGVANGPQGSVQDMSAYIDPMITVPEGYTLLLSPGVGNSISVPEPSTWAMFLLGFAGLGFAGYRTSHKAVSITA